MATFTSYEVFGKWQPRRKQFSQLRIKSSVLLTSVSSFFKELHTFLFVLHNHYRRFRLLHYGWWSDNSGVTDWLKRYQELDSKINTHFLLGLNLKSATKCI